MSVLKIIIADDRYYLCGEVHGGCAQWIYAACSRNPASLEELDRLLPEFGATENLRGLFGHNSAFDFTPVDAGLIIVDLAKKWIYAEDSYFGAHRRGRYQPRDDEDKEITYEFSEKWQFVAEAKWFNYLRSCDLQPYGNRETSASETGTTMANQDRVSRGEQEISLDDLAPMLEPEPDDFFYQGEEDEIWDEEMAGIEIEFVNRWTGLIYFEPQNAAEERDLQTLEHILRYEQRAAIAQHKVQQARKEIAALQIELQAVQNLWNRKGEPRWGLKRIHIHGKIEQQEKRISHLADEQIEAAAMAAELRILGSTEKFRETVKSW